MIEIHKERFEAWLFSQPRDRRFEYRHRMKCMNAMFCQETMKMEVVVHTDRIFDRDYANESLLPAWNIELLYPWSGADRFGYTSFGEVQDRWKELWPETPVETAVNQPGQGNAV